VTNERELLKGNTPTLILAVLQDGPLHCYAIAHEIEKRSGDILKFKHGTLYPALHALELAGFVAGAWEQGDTDRPRRVYRITPSGQGDLAKRLKQWAHFSKGISNVVGGTLDEQPA
jgi:PadR family transcriptional regulator PadR